MLSSVSIPIPTAYTYRNYNSYLPLPDSKTQQLLTVGPVLPDFFLHIYIYETYIYMTYTM